MSSSNHAHNTSDPNFILSMQNFRISDDPNHQQQPGSASRQPTGPVYENIEYYSSPTPSASIDQHLSHYGNFESSNKRAQPQVPTVSALNYQNSPNGHQSYGQPQPPASQQQPLHFQHRNQPNFPASHQYLEHIPIYENLPTAPKPSLKLGTNAQPQKPPAAPAGHLPKAAIYLQQNPQHNNDTYVPHMPPYTVAGQYASGPGIGSVTQTSATAARYSSNNTPPSGGYSHPGVQTGGHYASSGGQYPSRVHSPAAQSNVLQSQQYQQVIGIGEDYCLLNISSKNIILQN